MVDVIRAYFDDSGTRHPDHVPPESSHNYDWFGIGGVLINERDVSAVEKRHDEFCAKWNIQTPLHSHEIRHRTKTFRWLRQLSNEKSNEFLGDLAALASSPEFTAIACVIDRPGYNYRYKQMYGEQRWLLCKTAFAVAVERAAKFALKKECRLRVYVERSDKGTDRILSAYYKELRERGHPFNEGTASKYTPLAAAELQGTLYDFKTKDKTSRLMQLADICLWPMCIGGYDPENRAYVTLRDAGVLVDCKITPESVEAEGIKYSCWDLRNPKNQNPGDCSSG